MFYNNIYNPRIFGVLSMRRFFYVFLLVISAANVSFSDELVKKAQTLLNAVGYNAGPVDGLIGKKTKLAMANAMNSINKDWSGKFNEPDIDLLASIEKSIYGEEKDIKSLTPLNDLTQILNAEKAFRLSNEAAFYEHRSFVISEGFPGDKDWEFCLKDFSSSRIWTENIGQDTGKKFDDKMRQLNCTQTFLTAPDISPKHMEEFSKILVSWVENTNNVWTLPKKNIGSNHWYSALSFFGNLGQWYVFYEKKLPISTAERGRVREDIKDYLLQASFEGGLNFGGQPCPANPIDILDDNVDTDWCGSVRWKVATGKLSLGMYLEDVQLMNSGIKDLNIVLATYDSDAYNIPYSPAKKQAHAFNYYYQQARFLSVLVELFAMRGFDFLHYKLPNGGTVKRALDFSYEVAINDFKKLGKYPASGISNRLPKASWERVIKFSHQDFIIDNESYHGAYDVNTPRIQFAAINPRYAQIYKPQDFALSYTYKEQISSFSAILARSIFVGSNHQSIQTLAQQSLNSIENKEVISVINRKLNCLGPLDMSGRGKYRDGHSNMQSCLSGTNLPEAIKRLGIIKNINGLITTNTSSINLGVPTLKDYRPPNDSGKSERFEVKFENIKNADLSLKRETISIYKRPDEVIIGIWLEDIFEEDQKLESDWKSIYDKCGQIVEDSEYYSLEIPIKSNWEELNDQFECIAENTNSPKIKQLIGLLVHAAEKIDLESLRPSYLSGENKVLKLSYFTELSDDNFEPVLEAYDMIEYSIENDVLNVTHFDVSEEGVKGRDKLNYTLISEGGGTIIISGKVDVLDGDIVKVEMKSGLSPGTKEIKFAGNDRLVLTWE